MSLTIDSTSIEDASTQNSVNVTGADVFSDASVIEEFLRWANVGKKRRKYRYYDRRVKPFPRILKRDIRRLYANILANVINSSNVEFMVSFIRQFCTPEVQYVYTDSQYSGKILAAGWKSLAVFLATTSRIIPDMTMTIDDVQIKQTLNEKGSVVQFANVTVGSKLYRIVKPESRQCHIPSSCDLILGDIDRTVSDSASLPEEQLLCLDSLLLPQFAATSQPTRNTARWTVSLVLDECNLIMKMDYEQLSVETVPIPINAMLDRSVG